MVLTTCTGGNLWISGVSLNELKKFQCRSDHSRIKCKCALLFLRQIFSLFLYDSNNILKIISWTPIVKVRNIWEPHKMLVSYDVPSEWLCTKAYFDKNIILMKTTRYYLYIWSLVLMINKCTKKRVKLTYCIYFMGAITRYPLGKPLSWRFPPTRDWDPDPTLV